MEAERRHKRTQNTSVLFTIGTTDKWAFDFPSIFRSNIDIVFLNYVDKFKTAELRRTEGHEKTDGKQRLTVFQRMWTRGVPPVRSFEKGHIFL